MKKKIVMGCAMLICAMELVACQSKEKVSEETPKFVEYLSEQEKSFWEVANKYEQEEIANYQKDNGKACWVGTKHIMYDVDMDGKEEYEIEITIGNNTSNVYNGKLFFKEENGEIKKISSDDINLDEQNSRVVGEEFFQIEAK